MSKHRVIGLSGSLRERSYNSALLRAARKAAPPELEVEIDTIAGIPLYNGDVEREHGPPDEVERLRERIGAADGLLLVTPEYNHSMPGVLKNAIDWLSRPPKLIGPTFGGKPVAIMGATPGRGGTRLSQAAWLPTLGALGLVPFFEKELYVAGAGDVFDDELELVDETVEELLGRFMRSFAGFVNAIRQP